MTPLQVRHHSLPLAKLRGYERGETDSFLKRIANDYEALWVERRGLKERLEEIESQLQTYREREALIAEALIVAERSAAEIRSAANAEAASLKADAEIAAQELGQVADSEARALVSEAQTMMRQLDEEAARALERHEDEVDRLQKLSHETRDKLSTLLVDTLHRAGIDIRRLEELEASRRSSE